MAEVNINLKCDLQHAVRVQYLEGNMFSQDAAANTINIEVTDGGAPAEIGGTVSANVIRPDGGTVAVTGGTIDGNIVSITLPAACYALVGMITIVVKLTDESTVTTLAAAVAYVYQSSTDVTIDPGTIIPSIEDLIDAIDTAVASIPEDYSSLWTKLAPAFSSSTAYKAGQYVTYNSGLYRFTKAHAAGSWASGDVVAVNIGGELTDLKSALDVNRISTEKDFEQITGSKGLVFIRGYFKAYNNNTAIDTDIPTESSNYVTAICTCQEGDRFFIKAQGGATSATTYGFLNSSKQGFYRCTSSLSVNGVVTAPENAAYIIINHKIENGADYYAYKGASIQKRLTEDMNVTDNLLIKDKTAIVWSDIGSETNPYGWKPGYIDSSGIVNDPSTSEYIRSLRFRTGLATRQIVLVAPDGFGISAAEYEDDGTFVQLIGSANTSNVNYTGRIAFNTVPENYYIFTMGKQTAEISASDITQVLVNGIKGYEITFDEIVNDSIKKDINLSLYAPKAKIIRNDGYYESGEVDSKDCYEIRVSGVSVKITSNNTINAVYALLKSVSTNTSGLPDYCEGETGFHRIPVGASELITLPADCKYLYIRRSSASYTSGAISPSSITVYFKATDTINEIVKEKSWAFGKKIGVAGHSVAYGAQLEDVTKAWPYITAGLLNCSIQNVAVGGSLLAKISDSYEEIFFSLSDFNAAVKDTSKTYLVKDDPTDAHPFMLYVYRDGAWVPKYNEHHAAYGAYSPVVDVVRSLDDDVDLIIIDAGSNDYSYARTPLGEFTDRSKTTFYGALHVLLRYLMETYKGKPIFFTDALVTYSAGKGSGDIDWLRGITENDVGHTYAEYQEATMKVCAYYGVPYFNMYAETNIPPYVYDSSWFQSDKKHMTEKGHARVGQWFAGKIKDYLIE